MPKATEGRNRGMESATTLKTIDRALDVLEAVAASDSSEQPQVRDIAKAIGHNLSSTYHIVNTLLARHYLERDALGRLRIGSKASELHNSHLRGLDLLQFAQPLVADLAERSGETVYLTRYVSGRVVIQAAVESRKTLRVTSLDVGHSGSEDRRAAGKAVLAHLPEGELLRILRGLHPQETAEELQGRLTALHDEFENIRGDGFAFESESFEQGVCCMAAPFFERNGAVAGSLSVSAPTLRISHLLNEVRDTLLEASRRITTALESGMIG